MKRPLSISIIAWFFMVSAGLMILLDVYMLATNNSLKIIGATSNLSISYWYTASIAGIVINLALGIGLLKVYNWSRILYVVLFALGFLAQWITSPLKWSMVPGLLFSITILFLLYRPTATAYFTGKTAPVDKEDI